MALGVDESWNYDDFNRNLRSEIGLAENDIIIHKTHGNAFEGTDLGEELDSRGIRNIIITGLVTNGCIRATCIGGYELGYRVILVEDGHGRLIPRHGHRVHEA